MAKRIITIPGTLSYPNLDKAIPPKNGKGEPKFSAAFLFHPGTFINKGGMAVTVTAEQVAGFEKSLWAALVEAAEETYGTKAAQMLKTGALKNPLRKDWEAKGYPEGTLYFNARSSNAPGLVYPWADPESVKAGKPKAQKIPQDKITKELYPGARVIASVTAFYYDNESKGVSFGLNNVQLVGDGPRLDSQKAAEDEFSADAALTPADLATLEG